MSGSELLLVGFAAILAVNFLLIAFFTAAGVNRARRAARRDVRERARLR